VDPGDDLVAASIDELYEAFATYPRPVTVTGCGCGVCFDGRQVPGATWRGTTRPLVEIDPPGGDLPLREIDAATLDPIVQNVPLTGGNTDVLRHYLPRILEIVSAEDYDAFALDWPDMEIVISRIAYDGDINSDPWWNWPEPEQAAIRSFFDALWARNRRAARDADDTLCALGVAVPDIAPYLRDWDADDSDAARASVRDFRESNAAVYAGGTLWNAYWEDEHEPTDSNRRRVVTWLLRTHPTL
jgi:hypothetical protein